MPVNPVSLELPDLVNLKEHAESLIFSANEKFSLTGFGDKKSPFRSRGLDFQEVRVYQPGDDIRQIDWRVTAKYGEPFTKLYTEERDQQIYLICDLRPNMQFASRGHFKSVIAGRLTALSAFMADKKKNRLSYILLTNKIISSINEANTDLIPTLLNQLTQPLMTDSSIAFSDIISHLESHLKTGASLIFFSDFYDLTGDELKYLGQLGQKNALTFIHIYDDMERQLPDGSLPYSNGKKSIIMEGEKIHKIFQKSWDEQTNLLRYSVQKYGYGYLALSTNSSYLNIYSQFCWGNK